MTRRLPAAARVGVFLLIHGAVSGDAPAIPERDLLEAPAVVQDIAITQEPPTSSILASRQVDDMAYFVLGSPRGTELWTSDGTPEGTRPLRTLARQLVAVEMADLHSKLIFTFPDESVGREIWMSEGTTDGTVLLKDIQPGDLGGVTGFALFRGEMFFQADDGVRGGELWKTDGTPEGTVLVADYIEGRQGSRPHDLTVVGDALYFFVIETGNQFVLLRSDGTHFGTTTVKTLSAVYNPLCRFVCNAIAPAQLTEHAGRLVFSGHDGFTGIEPWVNDGTPQGTAPLADIYPGLNGSSPSAFTEFRGTVYFSASSSGFARGLWKTDGTSEGTALVSNLRSSSVGSSISKLTPTAASLYFVGFYDELWRSDGTGPGTWLVKDLSPGVDFSTSPITDLTAIGETLYFVGGPEGGRELWVSDGTEANTRIIHGATPGSPVSVSERLVPLRDGVVFKVSRTSGEFLYGITEAVPEPIELDTFRIPGSDPIPGVNIADSIYFRATDSFGANLWRTDHSTGETQKLGGPATPVDAIPVSPVAADLGGILVFRGTDLEHGGELWRSDGTPDGTRLILDLNPGPDGSHPYGFRRLGSFLMFSVHIPGRGAVLMRTDGTPEGTTEVRTMSPAPFAAGIFEMVVFKGRLYFHADDGIHGHELWTSDGTPAGTALLKDIHPGPHGSSPSYLTVVGDHLFFRASRAESGSEIWVTDGTAEGTGIVKDVRPGFIGSDPQLLRSAGGLLFFVATVESFHGDLWRSDGTTGGTFPVRESRERGLPRSAIGEPTAVGATLFFTDYTATHGVELWASDGTRAGTRLVADLIPGPVGSVPNTLAEAGGVLVFSASDGTSGWELWRSDGTATGTRRIQDIHPGPLSANPGPFGAAGSRLFFAAEDRQVGRELLSLPLSALSSSTISRPSPRSVGFRP